MTEKALKTIIKNLPDEPGIYKMLGDEGVILYVGKAKNLKKRVSSYFTKQNHTPKTKALVAQIKDIEINITKSENEALILECNLIKALTPKYNVLLRDDKSYPYIYVNTQHEYPLMELIRRKQRPKSGRFFGPYPSVLAVKETLNLIQKIFKIRNCRDSYFNARSRPCLQYQIKRCTAPCVGYIAKEDYKRSVKNAMLFLEGKSEQVVRLLQKDLDDSVHNLNFEEAAIIRDKIKSIRQVQEKQGVMGWSGDIDTIVLDIADNKAWVQWVSIRDGQILNSKSFSPNIQNLVGDSPENDVFKAFVNYFYVDFPIRIPPLIITDLHLDDKDELINFLSEARGKKCIIKNNVRGAKKEWLNFARKNLHEAIKKHAQIDKLKKLQFSELAAFVGIELHANFRMECFDISHTQGNQTVASCVVFDENGPKKSAYRRYNIEGITKSDDYAAMRQALTRRYRKMQNLPDLLVIDGGKGQLGVASEVLKELNISSIKIMGVAKGVTRKPGLEKLIFPGLSSPKQLPENSKALHLIQQIRDEAHRFAITFHRSKRQKESIRSRLEAIEKIGPKRRKALIQHFGGIQDLHRAPLSEIAKVKGISAALAKNIYDYLHRG